MIRQQAFAEKRKMLKGGLHCHTTRSDGQVAPDETIRLHKANGYDFLALTDHRFYNYQNFAPEVEITIIPGMEYDNTFERNGNGFRCFHTVCIGPQERMAMGMPRTSAWKAVLPKIRKNISPTWMRFTPKRI